jgi:hypothetical protein
MRYLKRLKIELDALKEKLNPPGDNPTFVSSRKVNRMEIIPLVIALLHAARAADHATEDWASERATQWREYIVNMKHWLGQMPQAPAKMVEKKKAAA